MNEQEFLRALQDDPDLINKLKKQSELSAFKERYDVERASPLKCPACSNFVQFPGTLWIGQDDTHFVCRKCKLEFTLICHTVPNTQLIPQLREVIKAGNGTLDWYRHLDQNKEE